MNGLQRKGIHSKSIKSFNQLKQAVCNAPILNLPDMNRPFILRTDASDTGLGAMSLQGPGWARNVVSRSFCLQVALPQAKAVLRSREKMFRNCMGSPEI